MFGKTIFLILTLSACAGCRTTSNSAPAFRGNPEPVLARPQRAWEVIETDRVIGLIVQFDALGGGTRRFFSVRNAWHQELGMVDAVGRAWRYRPHEEEAQWVGTGTVIEGAARILGTQPGAELIEVRLETLRVEAAHPPATAPR